MAAANRPPLSERFHCSARKFLLSIRGTCGGKTQRKFLEPDPNAAGTPGLDWQMKEQPNSPSEFWTHVYPIRLPHRSSVAGARLMSRLTTASRRRRRGLDTSLSPRPFSPPCGECAGVAPGGASTSETQTEAAEIMVEVDMGSPFRLRRMRRNG